MNLSSPLVVPTQTLPAYAQNNRPKFKRLTPNEGLSQGHVTAIVKDRQGFMWFGTDEGLILLDVQLPDIDGFELTTKIRSDEQSKNKKTPIVLFSAHTGINDEKIKNCGANDIIRKPFQPEDLLLKIERNVTRT